MSTMHAELYIKELHRMTFRLRLPPKRLELWVVRSNTAWESGGRLKADILPDLSFIRAENGQKTMPDISCQTKLCPLSR
jgi:hypothetical protein